jgi:alpha-L-fucosidase 2
VTGLHTRGGFVVDLDWSDGKLNGCKLHSTLGKPVVVRYDGKEVKLELPADKEISLDADLNKINAD